MGHIRFDGVSKIFHRHTGQKLIRHHFRNWFQRNPGQDFYALKNVSFEVKDGDLGHLRFTIYDFGFQDCFQ